MGFCTEFNCRFFTKTKKITKMAFKIYAIFTGVFSDFNDYLDNKNAVVFNYLNTFIYFISRSLLVFTKNFESLNYNFASQSLKLHLLHLPINNFYDETLHERVRLKYEPQQQVFQLFLQHRQ